MDMVVWVLVALAQVALALALPEATKQKMDPTHVDFQIFSLSEDTLDGEVRFEKALFDQTNQMNGYAAYMGHSCDGYVTLMEAQKDDQNPRQKQLEAMLDAEEEAASNATDGDQTGGAGGAVRNQLAQAGDQGPPSIPESLIPVGWREQMGNIRTPAMVDTALQANVHPVFEWMTTPGVQVYDHKFSVGLPSLANVMVLYGGSFVDDPKFVPTDYEDEKPGTMFIPKSKGIHLQIRKESDRGLYHTPQNAVLERRPDYGMNTRTVLSGVLTFTGAVYENVVTGYAILFGKGPHSHHRLGTEYSLVHGLRAMPRRPDGVYEVHFTNVAIPPNATHLLVFGNHPQNCNKPAAVELYPEAAPTPLTALHDDVSPDMETVMGLSLKSAGLTEDRRLSGTVTFTAPPDDRHLEGFVLEWAAERTNSSRLPVWGGNPLKDFALAVLFKAPDQLDYTEALSNVRVPTDARYLKVSGFREYIQNVKPEAAPQKLATPAFVPLATE